MNRVVSLLVLSFFAVSLSACAPKTPPNPLATAGSKNFPMGDPFFIFPIPSEGDVGDQSYIENSQVYGVSPLASRLAQLLESAESGEFRIVVGGPSSQKSAQVVVDAVKLNSERTLGGLILVFVGEKEDAAVVRGAIEKKLGTFLYSPMPVVPNPES